MVDTYAQLYVHLVWGTKWRRPWIGPHIRQKLHLYMAGVGRRMGSIVFEINGIDDHVHVLCGLPPTLTVPDFVGQVKQRSSWWMNHRTDVEGFAWQTGYSAFSVSHSMVPRVRRYIQRQEEHHRTQSFGDEYDVLLRRHGLGQDDCYPVP